jgi:hypothetical protein
LPSFYSQQKSFFEADITNQTHWFNPPWARLHEFLLAFELKRSADPFDISALIVVPK